MTFHNLFPGFAFNGKILTHNQASSADAGFPTLANDRRLLAGNPGLLHPRINAYLSGNTGSSATFKVYIYDEQISLALNTDAWAESGTATLTVTGGATAASKTITIADNSLVDGVDTLTVGTKTYTFVSGSPSGDQIQIGGSASATATNIATKLTADTATIPCASAAAVGAVVTVTGTSGGLDFALTASDLVKVPVATVIAAVLGSTGQNFIIETGGAPTLLYLTSISGTQATFSATMTPGV